MIFSIDIDNVRFSVKERIRLSIWFQKSAVLYLLFTNFRQKLNMLQCGLSCRLSSLSLSLILSLMITQIFIDQNDAPSFLLTVIIM